MLREELRAVNYSLPKRRKTLKELLSEEYPHVELRDGGTHMFRRSELDLAVRLLGEEGADRLRLPIILEVVAAGNELRFEVGEGEAVKLICRVLGIEEPAEPPLTLYPLQLAVLRRRIGTLLVYAVSYKSLMSE